MIAEIAQSHKFALEDTNDAPIFPHVPQEPAKMAGACLDPSPQALPAAENPRSAVRPWL